MVGADGLGSKEDAWVFSLIVLAQLRVLRSRRIDVLGGRALIARRKDIGMLPPLKFSCSSSHGSIVRSLAVLTDGRLASGGKDGKIKLWLVDEQKLIAALCLRAGRDLSKEEWVRYIGSDTPWQPSCRDLPSNWRTPDP